MEIVIKFNGGKIFYPRNKSRSYLITVGSLLNHIELHSDYCQLKMLGGDFIDSDMVNGLNSGISGGLFEWKD